MKNNNVIIKLVIIMLLSVNILVLVPAPAPCFGLNSVTAAQNHSGRAKMLFKKFFIAVLGVGCSACSIYILAFLFKKARSAPPEPFKEPAPSPENFDSPDTLEDSVNLFLTKFK